MPNKDELYNFLKKHKGIKFRAIHIADLFKSDRFKIGDKLLGMYRNKLFYHGFDREQIKAVSKNNRDYLCYVYFVK